MSRINYLSNPNKTLCNVFTGYKDGKTVLVMIERDNDTNEKNSLLLENPTFGFYSSKLPYRDKHADEKPLFVKQEELDYHECSYNRLFGEIGSIIKTKDLDISGKPTKRHIKYMSHLTSSLYGGGNVYNLKKMFSHPFIFNCDMELADYYISKWKRENAESINTGKLSKAYFDIESDTIDHIGFPHEDDAPCKTSAISYFFNGVMHVYLSFDLARDNPKMKYFVDNQIDEFKEYMKKEYGIDKMEFHIFNFEIDMIMNFFTKVNDIDEPDILSAWNLSYDFKTLYNRIKHKGKDPADVMSSTFFRDQGLGAAYYFTDKKANDISKKRDYAHVASSVQFNDQMLSFAKIRVTMGKRESYSLNDILSEELGIQKVNLDEDSIKTIIYTDYWKFVEYSVIDTYRLHQLEEKNRDTDLLYALMMVTSTRIQKVLTKTVSLKNLVNDFLLEQFNVILANNPNQNQLMQKLTNLDEDESFKGAFVANPNLNDFIGVKMKSGLQSRYIYNNVIDLDLASLYPHIILSLYLSLTTMYFAVDDSNNQFVASDLMELLSSRDYIAIGEKMFNLPTIEEWLNDIEF